MSRVDLLLSNQYKSPRLAELRGIRIVTKIVKKRYDVNIE